jgi:indole-3-glycerol phosphate synthase
MNILDEIFAHKRVEVAERQRQRPLSQVRREVEAAAPAQDFVAALRNHGGTTPALIAEVKHASPSRGVLVENFDPLRLARIYQENGAAAISVLTDERYFQGCLEHLSAIAQLMSGLTPRLPLLRKDFTCDPYQVYEARAAGADAMLLIAAYLSPPDLRDLHALIRELGMTALVEVHSRAELESVLAIAPQLVGINNRDLRDFTVRLETTLQLRSVVPAEVCLVAESGIHTPADVARLAEARVDAILVGEALVKAKDIPASVRSLAGKE